MKITKNQREALEKSILIFWNDFAIKNGYAKVDYLDSKTKKKIRQRIMAESDFLKKIDWYFEISHKHLDCKNEFGSKLNLREFLRNATTLRALRAEYEARRAEYEVRNG